MNVVSPIPGRRTSAAVLAAVLAIAALAFPGRASAQIFAQPEGDRWAAAVAFSPWLPTINGDMKYTLPSGGDFNGDFNIKIGPNDYLTNINFVLPIVLDVRNQKWSVLTDVMYIDISQDANVTAVRPAGGIPITVTANLDTSIKVKGLVWNEAFGWTVAGHPSGTFMDLIVGVRYFGLKTDTKWHLQGTVDRPDGSEVLSKDGGKTRDVNLWDGVFGLRGKVQFGEHFSLPYYADVGLGTSKVTWQGNVGIAWAPGKMEFALCYRYMSWAQKEEDLVQGLRLGGPELAIGYRF